VYHAIQFTVAFVADLEVSRKQHLERLQIRKGDRFIVQMRPHVLDQHGIPIEVADLFLDDGSIARNVPFAYFTFVDEEAE
jgi:hypothetical protein